MWRTEAQLADGRCITYFDDVDRGRRPVPDQRLLEPRPPQGELRLDELTGELVAVAGHRQERTFLPRAKDCPLCPGQEVPDPAYDVAVFENRWPSFAGGKDHPEAAAGRCEVIAFTDRHDASFADLGSLRARTVVDAWADRSARLGALPEVAYVACFENRGEAIGVTLHHPHGQIYGYPFVPPAIAQLHERAATDPGLYERVLAAELAGERVVAADDGWVAYVPRAARWPYELIVMPRRDVWSLADLAESERSSLAELLPPLLGRFDALFDQPVPYIAAWRQSSAGGQGVRAHLRVLSPQRARDRLKYLAGSESAYGAFVNDVAPEDAAARLRKGLG